MFAVSAGLEELYLAPEEDIAPGSVQPVIHVNGHGERQIKLMRWGFKKENGRLLFNARAEGIPHVNFWRKSFTERRCIVPADSFFEWQKVKEGKKPKFEVGIRDRKPFGMAGLWSPWKNPNTDQWEDTFAIMTVDANETMAPIHERQPAILEPCDYRVYLENAERPPNHLLRILPGEEMKIEAVNRELMADEQANLFDSQ
jgi:putative SOS response-associated peptidase YedK